jgi:hypothetical protein
MSTAPCNIFHSLLHWFLILLILLWPRWDDYVTEYLYTGTSFQFWHTKLYYVSFGTKCSVLETQSYDNEMGELRLEYKV